MTPPEDKKYSVRGSWGLLVFFPGEAKAFNIVNVENMFFYV